MDNESNPTRLISPAETLQTAIKEAGMCLQSLAFNADIKCTTLDKILHNNLGIDEVISVKLAGFFDTDPDYWLALETTYRAQLVAAYKEQETFKAILPPIPKGQKVLIIGNGPTHTVDIMYRHFLGDMHPIIVDSDKPDVAVTLDPPVMTTTPIALTPVTLMPVIETPKYVGADQPKRSKKRRGKWGDIKKGFNW